MAPVEVGIEVFLDRLFVHCSASMKIWVVDGEARSGAVDGVVLVFVRSGQGQVTAVFSGEEFTRDRAEPAPACATELVLPLDLRLVFDFPCCARCGGGRA